MIWMLAGDDEAAAIRELSTLSDRAAAIVGGALLERRLQHAISLKLHDTKLAKNSLHEEVFRTSGPLGSFSAKLNLGFMIGMYSAAARKDLDNLKEVRNAFAHRLDVRDFTTDAIKARCENLKIIERHVFREGTPSDALPPVNPKLFEPDLDKKLADPRSRYLLAVRFFVAAFTELGTPPTRDLPKPPF